MNVLEAVKEWWGWAGISPMIIVGESQFGNLLIQDEKGKYWRLCPEETYCQVVACNRNELDLLFKNVEFLDEWYMTSLVYDAHQAHGALPNGMKYCLKVPASLGGLYDVSNIGVLSLLDLIVVSGQIGKNLAGSLGAEDVKSLGLNGSSGNGVSAN